MRVQVGKKERMVNGIDLVQMIHPTSVGGETWYLSTNPAEDPRFNSPNITGNYTDGFSSPENSIVMTIETSVGYNLGSVRRDVNHAFIASTGFMYRSNDWRDCEMTGYFDCRNVIDKNKARIKMFARSAEIPEQRQWCPGTFYMAELAMDGRFRWVKGQYHLSYVSLDWIEAPNVFLGTDLTQRLGGWFGLKIVMNNEDIGGGQQGVRLWAYVDKQNNNSWQLINTSEVIDRGGWGADGGFCKGKVDQIITWGGPLATFELDNGSNIIFKKLSVREIDVGGQFLLPSPSVQAPAAAEFARVLAMTVQRYRIGTSVTPTCAGEIPGDNDPPPPPPPPPLITVTKKIAHKYKINSARTTIVGVDEFPPG